MIVKVAPLGERVVEVNVASGTTVREILDVAKVMLNDRSIRLNNGDADEETQVHDDNSIITLANKMKGGL